MNEPRIERATLRVRGCELYDTLGRQVILRGVNVGGRSKLPPFLPVEFTTDAELAARIATLLDLVASWGANVLRVPFTWEAVEPTRGTYDETFLRRYAQLLDAAWARGMRCIVDFHQDVYASPFCGDGFPLWTLPAPHGPARHDAEDGHWFLQYQDREGPVAAAFDRFWRNDDGVLDAFARMWSMMAQRFSAHAGVAGFEIINEPGWGTADPFEFTATTLVRALEHVGREILYHAPDALIFGGGPGIDALMATTSLRNPELPQFVYAPHYYNPLVSIGEKYAGRKHTAAQVAALAQFGRLWQRPVLFGEFGGADHSPELREFLRDVYAALDVAHAHGTAWEASLSPLVWNHENLTLCAADGTERSGVQEIVRPAPRAIAGTLEHFAYDAHAVTFAADVVEHRGVSELFIPARHFGATPRITLTSGEHAYDARTSRLHISATANRLELRVSKV